MLSGHNLSRSADTFGDSVIESGQSAQIPAESLFLMIGRWKRTGHEALTPLVIVSRKAMPLIAWTSLCVCQIATLGGHNDLPMPARRVLRLPSEEIASGDGSRLVISVAVPWASWI